MARARSFQPRPRSAAQKARARKNALTVLAFMSPWLIGFLVFTLYPVVGVTDVRPTFTPAPGEVDQIVEVQLEHLQDASRIRTGTRQREGIEVQYSYLDLDGHHVWGATAMVLGEFLQLLI